MSKTTVVFYHVINDKEDKNSHNVFYISKPINLITLRDVKNEFPLIGTYHFRFKVVHSSTHAWVDINDESSFIPSFNSCIYAKVLRLSWLDRKHEIERNTKGGREIEIEIESESERIKDTNKDKEKDKEREERGKETDPSLERIISDHEKIKLHKREKILYDSREKLGNDSIDNSNNNNSKSKNNIDMLLFETTPHNKHSSANKNKRTDNEKDQNYFDLMFN